MAIFDASASTQGFNMVSLTAVDWNSYDSGGINSATEYSYLTDDGHDVQFYGSGFAGGSTPSAGTVTSGEIDLNNDDFFNPDISFSGFSGSLVTMTNAGANGNTSGFYGEILSGNDTVTGSAFDDTLKGLGGDDTIIGGAGADSLIGDAGADSLDGGDGNDTLEGGAGDDFLTDSFGSDVLNGGDDNDFISVTSGVGADSFDGGAGTDTIDWTAVSGSGINFDLAAGTATSGANMETMTNFENLKGTGGDDTIHGTTGDNSLSGLGGNDLIEGDFNADTISGGNGDDTLYAMTQANPGGSIVGDELMGEAGNDSLIGSGGDDTLIGGAGADSLDGGNGSDTASYAGSGVGVFVRLTDGVVNNGDATGDVLTSIENVTGSSFADQLIGSDLANRLDGGAGDDVLRGGIGNDVLIGGAGGDNIDGGFGTDTVDYTSASAGVFVNSFNGITNNAEATGDHLTSIEVVIGSSFADNLIGNDANNGIIGGAGDDDLRGANGADVLNGGAGFDTAVYFDSATGVFLNLQTGAANNGTATGDTLFNIENLFGSFQGDRLIGSQFQNTIEGWNGADTVTGGAGDDTFIFSLGDDHDTITDFAAGAATDDVINLQGFGTAFDSFAEVLAAASDNGVDATIDFGGGDIITLQGVTVAQLDASDFTFG